MTLDESRQYAMGKDFAQAYAKDYGMRDAITVLRVIDGGQELREVTHKDSFVAGMADALLYRAQGGR